MECGTKLKDKFLKNEGMVPFCEKCNAYRFPVFSAAVSMEVLSPGKDKVLLITSTATISLSNMRLERRMMSRCPRVTGSKLPGYMAMGILHRPFRLRPSVKN